MGREADGDRESCDRRHWLRAAGMEGSSGGPRPSHSLPSESGHGVDGRRRWPRTLRSRASDGMTRVWYMLVAAAFLATAGTAAQSPPQRYGFGTPAPQELITRLDTDVRPDGTGLPAGRGTASDGAQ